jgi:hypothetical protein
MSSRPTAPDTRERYPWCAVCEVTSTCAARHLEKVMCPARRRRTTVATTWASATGASAICMVAQRSYYVVSTHVLCPGNRGVSAVELREGILCGIGILPACYAGTLHANPPHRVVTTDDMLGAASPTVRRWASVAYSAGKGQEACHRPSTSHAGLVDAF